MEQGSYNDDYRHLLGVRIRDLRLQRQLTQEQLAQMAGIHRSQVSRVERGCDNTRLNHLLDLARALDVPIACIFDGVADPALPEYAKRTTAELLLRCQSSYRTLYF